MERFLGSEGDPEIQSGSEDGARLRIESEGIPEFICRIREQSKSLPDRDQ